MVFFEGGSPALSTSCSNSSNDSGYTDVCFVICVDVNGSKGPKIVGRDLFDFVVKENGLYPSGCDIPNKCTLNNMGYACACKVLQEGAMNY